MRYQSLFVVIFLFFIFSPPAWASEFGANRYQRLPAISTEAAREAIESTEEFYNRLPSPQFRYHLLHGGVPILNGGVGTGGVSGDNYQDQPYYCSGQDEAYAYELIKGARILPDSNPNIGIGNKGDYRVFQLEDRCRTEGGCGDIEPDGMSFILGFPLFATNCHPIGKRAFWEDVPDAASANAAIWRDHNMIDDRGFLYGRYLLKQVGVNPSVLLDRGFGDFGLGINVRETRDDDRNDLNNFAPYFLDIPYSAAHLGEGFTCAEGCKAGAYNKNQLIDCSPSSGGRNAPMDGEFLEHYQMLAEFFEKGLHNEISANHFGDVWQETGSLTVDEKKRRETVVNVWIIVKEMFGRIAWEERSSWRRWMDRIRGHHAIELNECAGVPRATLVEYRNGNICFKSGVVATCDAKRSMGSGPQYNTSGRHEGGRCLPSYGELYGSRRDRLHERGWGTEQGYMVNNINRGISYYSEERDRYVDENHEYLTASPSGGWVSIDGHAPYYFSLMVHQLIHAYYQEKLDQNRMSAFPQSHGALWEEELAVIAQALALSILQNHEFAPVSFGMVKEVFIRSVETERVVLAEGTRFEDVVDDRVVGVTVGSRFKYPNIPRGHEEVFLGPLFVNMRNIYKTLKAGRVDLARMMALLHSMGPMQDFPPNMCLDGLCSEFSLPEVESRGPNMERQPAEDRRGAPIDRNVIQQRGGKK